MLILNLGACGGMSVAHLYLWLSLTFEQVHRKYDEQCSRDFGHDFTVSLQQMLLALH